MSQMRAGLLLYSSECNASYYVKCIDWAGQGCNSLIDTLHSTHGNKTTRADDDVDRITLILVAVALAYHRNATSSPIIAPWTDMKRQPVPTAVHRPVDGGSREIRAATPPQFLYQIRMKFLSCSRNFTVSIDYRRRSVCCLPHKAHFSRKQQLKD